MATSKQKNVNRKHRKAKVKAKAKRAVEIAKAKSPRVKREPTTVWNRKPKEITLGEGLKESLTEIRDTLARGEKLSENHKVRSLPKSLSLTDPKSVV